jgi:ADP-ribose pyrophosphatase YjhB (NUDIX family)
LEEALFREVKQETGLSVEIIKSIGTYSRIFPERHDISIVYLCRCNSENVVLDNEYSEFVFWNVEVVLSNLHPFLQEVLGDTFL